MRGIAVFVAGLVLGSAVVAVAQEKGTVLTVHRIYLTDSDGDIRAWIFVDDDGNPRMLRNDGKPIAERPATGAAKRGTDAMRTMAATLRAGRDPRSLSQTERSTFLRDAGWPEQAIQLAWFLVQTRDVDRALEDKDKLARSDGAITAIADKLDAGDGRGALEALDAWTKPRQPPK